MAIFRYVAHSDWVSMDQISPWMGLAVIAAEDQKFPEHWGFDVASIEKALVHNERNETVFAVRRRFLSRQPKISFYGMGAAGFEKGWKPD
ncbi:monofunctional biosynthetic peptidoglycan transglycosylase [Escherichia coli]|uniref:Monofunctional biosynthetic peptidoglycan transglycosylase n=1 Tax=Escherichia coli TaxID=562 RepID=A0A485JC43_ECOLX|nr:monofunctional biosynthetic peptidoglycan transglycosylase [Escherichia coli]